MPSDTYLKFVTFQDLQIIKLYICPEFKTVTWKRVSPIQATLPFAEREIQEFAFKYRYFKNFRTILYFRIPKYFYLYFCELTCRYIIAKRQNTYSASQHKSRFWWFNRIIILGIPPYTFILVFYIFVSSSNNPFFSS